MYSGHHSHKPKVATCIWVMLQFFLILAYFLRMLESRTKPKPLIANVDKTPTDFTYGLLDVGARMKSVNTFLQVLVQR